MSVVYMLHIYTHLNTGWSSSARALNIESISSINNIQGANLIDNENNALINCDVSPTYLRSNTDGVILIIGILRRLQNDFARAVLPHPM